MLDKIKFDGLADEVVEAITVPEPDFHMGMVSSLNIDKGMGTNTFTRASTATYVDIYGELKTAAIDEPRLQKEGYLMELQGTNLVTDSGLKKASEGVSGSTVTIGTGKLLADTFKIYTATKTSSECYKDVALLSDSQLVDGKEYTLSVFININETTCKDINLRLAYGISLAIPFNLEELTVSSDKARITEVGGGIYRLSMTSTYRQDSRGLVCRVQKYNHQLGETFSICGAQVEEANDVSSYIPTNVAPVTRAADALDLSKLAWVKKDYTMSYELSIGKLPTSGYVDFISTQGMSFNLHRVLSQGVVHYVDGGGITGTFTGNSSNKIIATYDSNKTQSLVINGKLSSRPDINLQIDTRITGVQIKVHAKTGYNGSPYMHLKNLKIWRKALTIEQARGVN